MANPVIEFRDPNTPSTVLTTIALTGSGTNGAIVSGTASNAATVRVYNDYARSAGIPDAFNCALAAYDDPYVAGGATSQPVIGTWLQVAVMDYDGITTGGDYDTHGSTVYTPIGGATTHTVPVNGATLAGSLANPSVAPTGSAQGGGAFTTGTHYFGYTWTNPIGETQVSPLFSISLTSGNAFQTGALTLPAGATGVKWYMSVSAGSSTVALVRTASSGVLQFIAAYPADPSAIPPAASTANGSYITVNVRAAPPSTATVANVLQGLWLLYAYV